jgi:peptidoglycan DL-endopeptidase CwlO
MLATSVRRHLVVVSALLAALAPGAAALAPPASAVPGTPVRADPEGGSRSLRDALETAAKGYVQARTKLDGSRRRQQQLRLDLREAQAGQRRLAGQVRAIAATSYRLGRLNTATLLLNSASPDAFLQRAENVDMLAQRDARALADYRAAVDEATAAKQAIDVEIRKQEKLVAVLAARKKQAEQALGSVGGGAAGGFLDANSPLAKPAPRNPDGSWPTESCTVDDPTTSGCITPRLLNAYRQARAAGFTRYTSCFSKRSWGEHPKGRACDFSAHATGFLDAAATGGDRVYGNRLAAFLVKNADRLGVMYVIWYRQIWLPGSGWKRYTPSGGPSVVHTNHVHLSVL